MQSEGIGFEESWLTKEIAASFCHMIELGGECRVRKVYIVVVRIMY